MTMQVWKGWRGQRELGLPGSDIRTHQEVACELMRIGGWESGCVTKVWASLQNASPLLFTCFRVVSENSFLVSSRL